MSSSRESKNQKRENGEDSRPVALCIINSVEETAQTTNNSITKQTGPLIDNLWITILRSIQVYGGLFTEPGFFERFFGSSHRFNAGMALGVDIGLAILIEFYSYIEQIAKERIASAEYQARRRTDQEFNEQYYDNKKLTELAEKLFPGIINNSSWFEKPKSNIHEFNLTKLRTAPSDAENITKTSAKKKTVAENAWQLFTNTVSYIWNEFIPSYSESNWLITYFLVLFGVGCFGLVAGLAYGLPLLVPLALLGAKIAKEMYFAVNPKARLQQQQYELEKAADAEAERKKQYLLRIHLLNTHYEIEKNKLLSQKNTAKVQAASAGSRNAKRDFQVPLSPSSSALVCPPAADGLGRPAFAASDDAAPTTGSTAVRAGCFARQPLPSEGSSSSLTSSEVNNFYDKYKNNGAQADAEFDSAYSSIEARATKKTTPSYVRRLMKEDNNHFYDRPAFHTGMTATLGFIGGTIGMWFFMLVFLSFLITVGVTVMAGPIGALIVTAVALTTGVLAASYYGYHAYKQAKADQITKENSDRTKENLFVELKKLRDENKKLRALLSAQDRAADKLGYILEAAKIYDKRPDKMDETVSQHMLLPGQRVAWAWDREAIGDWLAYRIVQFFQWFSPLVRSVNNYATGSLLNRFSIRPIESNMPSSSPSPGGWALGAGALLAIPAVAAFFFTPAGPYVFLALGIFCAVTYISLKWANNHIAKRHQDALRRTNEEAVGNKIALESENKYLRKLVCHRESQIDAIQTAYAKTANKETNNASPLLTHNNGGCAFFDTGSKKTLNSVEAFTIGSPHCLVS